MAGGLAAAPASADEPAATAPSSDVARAEAALRTVIAQFQAGAPDYASMETPLADAVKAQPAVVGMVQGFGALQSVAYVGPVNGAHQFKVAFATAETTWFIALSPTGKIAGLVFR